MRIRVSRNGGDPTEVDVDDTITIAELKKTAGLDAPFRISYRGRHLSNDATVASSGLREGDLVEGSDEPEVTFSVSLPGARRVQTITVTLGDTIAEEDNCIKVKLGTDRDRNEYMIRLLLLKELEKLDNAAEIRDRLNNELGVMKLLDHRNILKLFQVFSSNERTYILLERCTVTLEQHLKRRGGKLPPNEARNYFSQLVSALHYMHGKGLVHRNVNLKTVLVDEECSMIKLAGFGYACLQSSRELLRDRPAVVDPDYSSPELKDESQGPYHGKQADSYSVVAVLYTLLTGEIPPSTPDKAVEHPDIPPATREIIEQALNPEWRQIEGAGRMSMEDIKKHPWVVSMRRHSSIDVEPVMLSQQVLESSLRQARMQSGINLTALRNRSKEDAAASQTEDDDGSLDGSISPDPLVDESFSPLPKHRNRPAAGTGEIGKDDMLGTPLKIPGVLGGLGGGDTDHFDLSPPASPSMKSRKQLDLHVLDGKKGLLGEGDVLDDGLAASPMGVKQRESRQLPDAHNGSFSKTEGSKSGSNDLVAQAIEQVVRENTTYIEKTGLTQIMEDMLILLLGAQPEGEQAILDRLIKWASREKVIRQEAKELGLSASLHRRMSRSSGSKS